MTDEEYEKRCEPFRKAKKEFEEQEQKRREEWLKECEKKGIVPPDPKTYPKQRCDSPYTMEDSTATVLWIVVMIVGSIFKGNWIIWIVSTIVWWKFISRYK